MHRRDFNIYNALGDVKSQNNRKVILITGPTASGKSELAIKTAIEKNGEIISADSMQIYKGMNIGTAKLRSNIPCHMIDIISINDKYSVYDYQKDAKENIRKVLEKGKLPIVCGGTGLYIDSLIY
ncbi:MAG: hypothetical protein LBD41_02770, partial [Clostridiales Family XIII bacterium]|nr:hypothetical protein [Clostridiales Family XIII bacterium]